jgi:hypothetical protein
MVPQGMEGIPSAVCLKRAMALFTGQRLAVGPVARKRFTGCLLKIEPTFSSPWTDPPAHFYFHLGACGDNDRLIQSPVRAKSSSPVANAPWEKD